MIHIVEPDAKDLVGTLHGRIELTELKRLIRRRGRFSGPVHKALPIRVEVIDAVAKGPVGGVLDIHAQVALHDDRTPKARCDTHENSFVLSVVTAARARRSSAPRGRRA